MKETSKQNKRLTDEETLRLINMVQLGDVSALETLYVHNINLIKMVAKRFITNVNSRFDFNDLFQEAYIGFVKAIEKYNPELKIKFSTIAVECMTNNIRIFLKQNCSQLKITSTFLNQLKTIKETNINMIKNGNLNPSLDEISKNTGIGMYEITEIIRAIDSGISLDTYNNFDHEKENEGLHELISDDDFSIDDILDKKVLKETLNNILIETFLPDIEEYSKEELYLAFEFERLISLNKKTNSSKLEINIDNIARKLNIINHINPIEDKQQLHFKYKKLYKRLREMAVILKRYYNPSGKILSQSELCEYFGVTQQVVSRVEITGLSKVKKKIINSNIDVSSYCKKIKR